MPKLIDPWFEACFFRDAKISGSYRSNFCGDDWNPAREMLQGAQGLIL